MTNLVAAFKGGPSAPFFLKLAKEKHTSVNDGIDASFPSNNRTTNNRNKKSLSRI